MHTQVTSEIVIPSNPADLKKIQNAVKEAEDSLIRIGAERDQLKAIIDQLHEDFPDIPKKYFRKMINISYKSNLDQVVSETDDLSALCESVSAAK